MTEQKEVNDKVDWEKLREEFSPDVIVEEEVVMHGDRRCVKVLVEDLGEVFVQLDESEHAGDFHHWNFRVIKEGEDYKICEVHYRENGETTAWADSSDNNLIWDNPEDLIGTYKHMAHAFEKPILEVIQGEKLREIEGSIISKIKE